MSLLTLSSVYCTQEDVEGILSEQGVLARLDDDGDGYISATEQARMTHSINRATETCNYYLYTKYSPTNLAQCNLVNHWCTDLAAYVMCGLRRVNPVPESLIESAQEAKDMMKDIMLGRGTLPGIAMRRSMAPTYDNIRVNLQYRWKVIRVERSTSSSQPTQIPINPDWGAEIGGYEI